MSILSIVVIGIIIAILVKTGSIGKAFSFFMAYLLWPGIFSIIGVLLMKAVGMNGALGGFIGAFVGLILALRKGSKSMK